MQTDQDLDLIIHAREHVEHGFGAMFQEVAKLVYGDNVRKGFWEVDRNDGECIALMHSELSEGLEALRHGNPPDDHIPQFSGLEAELADTVIRILDYAAGRNLNVGGAIAAKLEYNRKRPAKHGKQF